MPRYRSKNFPRLHKRDHEISGSWQRIFSLQHGSAQLQLYTEYLDSRIVKADRVSHRKVKDRPTITDFIEKETNGGRNMEDAYVKFPTSGSCCKRKGGCRTTRIVMLDYRESAFSPQLVTGSRHYGGGGTAIQRR